MGNPRHGNQTGNALRRRPRINFSMCTFRSVHTGTGNRLAHYIL